MWPQFELAIEGSSHNLNEQAIALQTDDDETKQHPKFQQDDFVAVASLQSDDDQTKQHPKCQEDCLIAVDPERVIFEDAKVSCGHLDTRKSTG